jgi:hypothetical protein
MTKPSTGELPPQLNEQPQPPRRNIYDCDGEYEFPTVQHWTATRSPFPAQAGTSSLAELRRSLLPQVLTTPSSDGRPALA